MTDRRYGPGRRTVAMVTTALVSLGTAAAVGWAAAVPVGGVASPSTEPGTSATAVRTAQQVEGARVSLQQVRRDLARLLSREDDLPRARLAHLATLVGQLPSVHVPQSSTPPVVTHATAPATHTTTGASGARP